ncbi:MAG: adenylyltransferase/cytidyltransferase family protein [Nanoarchaeota archaeon]
MDNSYKRVGFIGRFKPLHLGSAVMLETLCEKSEHVIIGIGSTNKEKYNVRNPFTPEETKAMIDVFLKTKFNNYETVFIPDYAHIPEYRDGQKWREMVKERYGNLDAFVTGNLYVATLLKDDYHIVHPAMLIPKEKHIYLSGTDVRIEMAKGGDWKQLVPEEVAAYLEQNTLVERFRKEFGLETLARMPEHYEFQVFPSIKQEHMYTTEV